MSREARAIEEAPDRGGKNFFTAAPSRPRRAGIERAGTCTNTRADVGPPRSRAVRVFEHQDDRAFGGDEAATPTVERSRDFASLVSRPAERIHPIQECVHEWRHFFDAAHEHAIGPAGR